MTEQFITEKDAAKMIGVNPRTLENWRTGYKENGKPARLTKGRHWQKIGSVVVFTREWVEAMVDLETKRKELMS